MKDLITDFLDLAPQHRLFQNPQSSSRSHSRSSQLQTVLEKCWIYHGFPPSNNSQLEFSNKKNLSSCPQRHLGDQAFGKEKWSSNCLAAQEINDFSTQGWATGCSCWAQSHSFPFLPAKMLCTWRKQSLCYTCRSHTPLPLSPDLTRGVRQLATQFHVYIQKEKE